MSEMKKICVIGSPGAGKSTLAIKLSEIFNLPVHHLDQMFWQPGWVEGDRDEMDKKLLDLYQQDAWIIDGMYSRTWEERTKEADTVIFLNYSRWLCLYRALKRVVTTYGKVREDMADGCPERFDWEFMKYIWDVHSNKIKDIEEKVDKLRATKTVLEFKNPRQTEKWLKGLKPA